MHEDTLEEIKSLGTQICIAALMAVSSVLLQALIMKIKYAHTNKYSPRRRVYEQDHYLDDDDLFLDLED